MTEQSVILILVVFILITVARGYKKMVDIDTALASLRTVASAIADDVAGITARISGITADTTGIGDKVQAEVENLSRVEKALRGIATPETLAPPAQPAAGAGDPAAAGAGDPAAAGAGDPAAAGAGDPPANPAQ